MAVGKLVWHKSLKEGSGECWIESKADRGLHFNSMVLGIRKEPMTVSEAKRVLSAMGWCMFDDIAEVLTEKQLVKCMQHIAKKY